VGLLFCCGACDFSDILFAFAPRQHNFGGPQRVQRILKSMPARKTRKVLQPQGCGFFISRTSPGANIHFYRSFQGVRI
jgi:hypothetical protein